MMKLGILGCSGRMGQAVEKLAAQSPDFTVAAGLGSHATPNALQDFLNNLDVVIDFSQPQGTHALLEANKAFNKPLVIGTTGLTDAHKALMEQAAVTAPVFYAPNMSIGVALMGMLIEQASTFLDSTWDVEMVESHHRYKKDAPSGTALSLAGRLKPRDVTIHSLRGGGVSGVHTVYFRSDEEEVTITHNAFSRDVFARGALKAAAWLRGNPPGLYGMHDMLTF